MASIICTVSAQFTQNIFLQLDKQCCGYLDQTSLACALSEVSRDEVEQLLQMLDQDGDQRISPYELNVAIVDWLSERNARPVSLPFASLVCRYGPYQRLMTKPVQGTRPHRANSH